MTDTAAQKPAKARPLSPHLQVYKWEITMFMSILHRMTGVGLIVACVLFTCWLLTTIKGGSAFTAFNDFARSPVGVLIAFFTLFAFIFHLLNGVRHLIWDTGFGFGRKFAHLGGWAVFAGSFIATVLIWNNVRGG